QRLALDQLEGRAAARREVVDAVVEAELGQRRGAVAAADDRGSLRLGDGLGDRARAGGEGLELERAHRAVPEDRPRVGYDARVRLRRVAADVEAHPAVGDVDAVDVPALRVGGERAAGDEVGRQVELVATGVEHALRRLDALRLAQRVADAVALR